MSISRRSRAGAAAQYSLTNLCASLRYLSRELVLAFSEPEGRTSAICKSIELQRSAVAYRRLLDQNVVRFASARVTQLMEGMGDLPCCAQNKL